MTSTIDYPISSAMLFAANVGMTAVAAGNILRGNNFSAIESWVIQNIFRSSIESPTAYIKLFMAEVVAGGILSAVVVDQIAQSIFGN